MSDRINNTALNDSINFIESKVLNPSTPPTTLSAKAIADQSAAMMVQDMRSFLQANQQVITIGLGKAIALSVNSKDPSLQKGGIEAIGALERLLMTMPQFAKSIETIANSILTEFGNPKAEYLKNQQAPSKPKSGK